MAWEVEEGLPLEAIIIVKGIAHNTTSTAQFGDYYRHVLPLSHDATLPLGFVERHSFCQSAACSG